MKPEFIILVSLGSLLLGIIAGTIISVFYYPRWEVSSLIKQQKKDGFSFGEWNHFRDLVDHHVRVIVKPNCETLYSVSFIQKKDGPYVLIIPAFHSYFSFAFIDNKTDVHGYFTNRDADGDKENKFLISYTDKDNSEINLPSIQLKSKVCWIIGRFEISNPEEIHEVNRVQDGISLVRLKDYLNDYREKD